MKGFIVYPTYDNIDDKTYIQLFGRLENGQSFVCMNKFEPYFFIPKDKEKRAKTILGKEQVKFEETPFTDFQENKVIKLVFQNQAQLNNLRGELHDAEINTFEADIKPATRFMMDKNLLGSLEIEGDYKASEKVDRIYENPTITPSDYFPKLKIVSIDGEFTTDIKKILCLGIYSENYKKTFMITKKKLKNTVSCKDEEDCLEKFKQELIDLDPDIIIGWNLIDFDFKYLKEFFAKHKIKTDFGRTNDNLRLNLQDNFFRNSSAVIPGRLVLDGLNFIKDPFIKEAPSIKNKKFISYSLENVSQAILETGKLFKGDNRGFKIEEAYVKNQQKLADYNLLDCELVYKILEKTDMINLAIERSQLTGLPLDKIGGSIAAFDSLYIREAHKRGLVSPTTRFTEKEKRITGGFVMSPIPGIYHNVLVLDFKSLYPSIIRTFNIDPSSFIEKKQKNCIIAPNNAYFKNQEGILPMIIETLHQAREKAKKEKRELSSYAIKVIMNSFFGVLASPNCRYFNLDIANAITNFGQELLKITKETIEKKHKNIEVIYQDTDSCFVNTNLSKEKANKLGKQIQEEINTFYDKYVKKQYKRKSFLELEFEKQYLSMLLPKIRGLSKAGAKKRYAGLVEDKKGKEVIQIIGLEAIRGDWTQAAQEFQRKLLDKIFHKKNPTSFIKTYIKELRGGKLDDKLIYKKSIRKNLEEYTKITPAHVKAARKLKTLESHIIRYYITTDGPEPIQDLKHDLDYDHYIDKQIKPIAETILELFNIKFEDLIQGSKQTTLF